MLRSKRSRSIEGHGGQLRRLVVDDDQRRVLWGEQVIGDRITRRLALHAESLQASDWQVAAPPLPHSHPATGSTTDCLPKQSDRLHTEAVDNPEGEARLAMTTGPARLTPGRLS